MTLRRNFLASLAAPLLARAQSRGAGAGSLPHPDDPAYWARVRDQFPLARDKVFFNNGTIGAMPKVVLDRTVEHLRKMATDVADWDYKPGDEWIAGYGPMTEIRTKTARLLNAGVTEIALTENVTAAMSYVAAGLELEPGSEILISDQEHPGGQSPWLNAAKRHGGSVQTVHIPKPAESASEVMDVFRNALNARTRVLAISHVITGSGAILPVKEMCAEARARGIFTVIDGAQAVGQIPVDLGEIGCDAYVGCFHKWLLAPAGNGFLYLRNDRAAAVWSTLASSHWNDHEDNGYRFTQRGTGSLSLLMGVDAALDFHNQIGSGRIHRAREVSRRLSARRPAQDSRHAHLYALQQRDVRRHHGVRSGRGDRAAPAGRDVDARTAASARVGRHRGPPLHAHFQQSEGDRSGARGGARAGEG